MGSVTSKQAKLSSEDLKELAKQTNCSDKEIKKFYKNFKKNQPDGKLTKEQFEDLYKKFFPEGDAANFAEHSFKTFDKDGDGTLDFHEFMLALSITTSRGTFQQKLKWAYNMYDLDGDGFITKVEMKEILASVYKMVGEENMPDFMGEMTVDQRVDEIFSLMDEDGNDQISTEEFFEGIKKDPKLLKLIPMGGYSVDENDVKS